MEYHLPLLAMSEEQLTALLAKLKDDAGLQEKLKGAADLLRNEAQDILELSDEELEGVAGGTDVGSWFCTDYC